MDFKKLLKNGYSIKIHKKQYTTSIFYQKDNIIYVKNKDLGHYPHELFTTNKKLFDNHIAKMIKENFNIDLIAPITQ